MIFHDTFEDTRNILGFIDEYTATIGVKNVAVDSYILQSVLKNAKVDVHYPSGGFINASPFKKIAVFVAYFVSLCPIERPFLRDEIGTDLHIIHNHQNSILALEIAIESLHGATIYRKDGNYELKDKIELSKHSYIDVVEAIGTVTPQWGWRLVSVLLEQMSYKTNPESQYT